MLVCSPDGLTQSAPWLDRIPNGARYLKDGTSAEEDARLGDFTHTGYPLGKDDWIDALETKSRLRLRPGLRGRPGKPER